MKELLAENDSILAYNHNNKIAYCFIIFSRSADEFGLKEAFKMG